MELAMKQYYNLNMFLLSLIGLWPYESTLCRRIRNAICWNFLLSGICIQISNFIDTEFTSYMFLTNTSYFISSIACLLKYITYYLHLDDFKSLLDHVAKDWRLISCKKELEILHKYMRGGQFHTKAFALVISPAAVATVVAQFFSTFLNIVAPLNESRPIQLPLTVNFIFFDYEKHVYLAILWIDIVILVAGTTFVATETIFLMFVHHACAHYAIISFSNNVKNAFKSSYFILLALGVSCLSINLYRISRAILFVVRVDELLISIVYTSGILIYMFYVNYMCEIVIDHSIDIFTNTYCSEWYYLPASSRKLFLFFMIKTMKFYSLNIYGFFTASIQGFSAIVRMSFSYFMVLYSRQ